MSTTLNESAREKLTRLVAAARAAKTDIAASVLQIPGVVDPAVHVDRNGNSITYNKEQLEFVTLASKGASCILIGSAGTGKTTSMRGTLEAMVQSGHAGLLSAPAHKHLPSSGAPGIVIISFTRRAVANIRKNLPPDLQANCLTYHALLQYEPVFNTVIDPATLEERKSMSFQPSYGPDNPLPDSIRVVVIEESSMFSTDFFKILSEALPIGVQYILLGDIQQLPPVFGPAILGYKMLEWPVVELTQVYRQALESPIIRLAHRILSGVPIPVEEFDSWKVPGKLTLHPWKKKLDSENATLTIAKFLKVAIDQGAYNPDEDMVLIPFNKSCGTIELNKHIAQHMARMRKEIVHEVIAGFSKICFSVGDKILYDKEDATVTAIKLNPAYSGKSPQPASLTMDYWGFDFKSTPESAIGSESSGDDDIDFLLSQMVAVGGDSEERTRQASHEITIQMKDTGTEVILTSAGDISSLLHSYVLTVHKSQGSEFRKVFVMLHQSHATMLQRELLYTAVTRAKEELYVICEPDSLVKGINNQKIKGNSLAEKAIFFQGKIEKLIG